MLSRASLEPFLVPYIRSLVIPVHLPVPIFVHWNELDFRQPFCAFPSVELWEERSGGEPLLGYQRLPIQPKGHDGIFVQGVFERYGSAVAISAMKHDPGRLLLHAS